MKTQRLSMDRISTLPQSLIEYILCLVPITDAARTSVLSREWRSKWTTIPKLVFDQLTFELSTDQLSAFDHAFDTDTLDTLDTELSEHLGKVMRRRRELFYASIFQVLSVHQGPIHEFDLSIDSEATCVDIDRIIVHLARNSTLKKFTLDFPRRSEMPLSVFSLHHLTDLNLSGFLIELHPVSSRFSSLTRLCLNDVKISTKTLLHLVSSCPLLTSFTLLHKYNEIVIDDDSTLIELFECLRMIEDLTISYWIFQFFVKDSYARELRTSLKYFCVEGLFFTGRNVLLSILSLIRCSPNLEKLKLHILKYPRFSWYPDIELVTPEDYSDIWLENLNELEIDNFGYVNGELDLVKLILAKSPVLKKVSIFLHYEVTNDEKMTVLRNLLCSPRASPHVKIFCVVGV